MKRVANELCYSRSGHPFIKDQDAEQPPGEPVSIPSAMKKPSITGTKLFTNKILEDFFVIYQLIYSKWSTQC